MKTAEFPYADTILRAVDKAVPSIHQHLLNGLPEEVVGMVLSDGTIVRLINQARSSARFEVGVPQLALALGDINPDTHTVIGIYHSHPGGSLDLSPGDQTSMKSQWGTGFTLPWIVVTEDFRASIWWLDPAYGLPCSYVLTPELVS